MILAVTLHSSRRALSCISDPTLPNRERRCSLRTQPFVSVSRQKDRPGAATCLGIF
jgi:hypothetical protein